jgi:signal peptidase II
MQIWKYFAITLLVIILDQTVKLLVHYNMEYGLAGEISVFGDWFKLHYTRNPGMAFGLELGSSYGKLILTLFRLVAMVGIAYLLVVMERKNTHKGFLVCMALILGGAIGNVIDSIFYGVFLDIPAPGASTPWFHGQVVDMFFFDIWTGILPDRIPFFGVGYYNLWPIFNIAESSIFVGIFTSLIFQNKFFAEPKKAEPTVNQESNKEVQS